MDLLGNRESVTIDGGTPETYAVDVDTNRYDADGTYTVTLAYDDAGNTTTDNDGYVYTYDYENRVETITRPSDSTIIVTYTYDALGRRIKMVDAKTAANSRWYYYSDGWQVLEEYDTNDTRKAYYVWGNYIDELLFIWNSQYQYAGQVLSDHLHSPTAILNINNGSILERYEYNAYGKATVWNSTFTTSTTTSTTTSSYGNPYLFTGRRLDTLDTGDFEVMYYRNRYYDTETGRFLQKDPAGYVDGMNLYEYVQSKPVFGLDPYGLDLDEEQKKYQKCWFRCEELARRNPSMVINDCRKKCKKVWKGQKMVVPTFGDIMGQIKKLTPCNGVGCIKPWTWELPPIPTPYGELKSSVGISGSVSKCKYKDKKKGTGLLLTIKLQANGQVCMGAGGKIPGYVDNSNKNFLPADCKVSSKCPTCEHKSGGKLQIFLYGRGGAYINGRIGLLATIIPFSEQKIEPVLSIGMGNYAGGQICLQVVGNVHRSYVMTK